MEPITRADPEKALPRILVVDDEPSLLRLMNHVLSRYDFEVITVTNAAEAMTYLESGGVDAVIVDAVMPVTDGYALTRGLRQHPVFAALPILMLSRKRERKDVERALQAGVSDYLVKPLDPELLVEKLNLSLKKSGFERAVYELHYAEGVFEGQVHWMTSIVSLSETGVTLHSSVDFPPDYPIRFTSSLFREIGITVPVCRVVDGGERVDGGYRIQVKFVGISEDDLQKIRSFIHREATKRKK